MMEHPLQKEIHTGRPEQKPTGVGDAFLIAGVRHLAQPGSHLRPEVGHGPSYHGPQS